MKVFACFFGECSPARQHEYAHGLLRRILRQEYGIETYTLAKNSHGKPHLSEYPEIHFNLSHCKGMAVCGVGCAPLGVDGEQLRQMRSGVVRRACAEIEAEQLAHAAHPDLMFTRIWTLKESFVKAIGVGVSYPMKRAAFLLEDGLQTNVTGAQFWQYVIAERYVISVCASAPEQECSLQFIASHE